ncbi:hypothetical protein [Blastopirellula marina]|nr:hypothetical protein [Blastopirellula marina]
MSFPLQLPTGVEISNDLAGCEIALQEFQRFGEMSVYTLYREDMEDMNAKLCLSFAGAWPLFPRMC